MKRSIRILIALGLLLLLSHPATAYTLRGGTICSGGSVNFGEIYGMRASIALPVIGNVLSETYRTRAGFVWDWWIVDDVIEPVDLRPLSFALSQNYPNPFNPRTRIRFEVPKESQVSIRLYDVSGRLVHVIVDDRLEPGCYESLIDASGMASGLYFCKMTAGSFQASRVLSLMK